MLANVQQRTIKPIIKAAVTEGTLIHTDEYSIYARLPSWGYGHKTVCHGRGEYAREEDGDLTIHQFSRQSQSFGSGRARSISLTAVRRPRVNQESLLLASFLG